MGITAGVFNETFEKMTREHCVFERMDTFLTKYGREDSAFIREWTFFD